MVLDALDKAARALSNDELAAMMGVTKSEASRRVAACHDALQIRRNGRCYAITPLPVGPA
jgi:hypothetical protein